MIFDIYYPPISTACKALCQIFLPPMQDCWHVLSTSSIPSNYLCQILSRHSFQSHDDMNCSSLSMPSRFHCHISSFRDMIHYMHFPPLSIPLKFCIRCFQGYDLQHILPSLFNLSRTTCHAFSSRTIIFDMYCYPLSTSSKALC